jgi:hypothetical protein
MSWRFSRAWLRDTAASSLSSRSTGASPAAT